MTTSRYIRLTAAADVASIRTASFENRDHLVVPVIALIGNSVVRPSNSTGPEFVPATELAYAPQGWDGRPVVPDHPIGDNDTPVSANAPEILEEMRFGRLFNTEFTDNKLKTEAWLDIASAADVEGADEVIARFRAGEMVEVSVGAYINVTKQAGRTPNGDEYEFVWSQIVPDHLAMGLNGAAGACSVETGCGAPRINKETKMAKAEIRLEVDKPSMLRLLTRRLISAIAPDDEPLAVSPNAYAAAFTSNQEGDSDSDVRDALWKALQAVEPGFDGVHEVFPDDGLVIYATWIDEDGWRWWRRGFAMAGDGLVTLADDREEVEMVTEWRVVVAAKGTVDETKPTGASVSSDCSCGKATVSSNTPAAVSGNTPTGDKGDSMNDKIKDLVGKLIASEASPFTDENKDTLAELGEAQLTYLLTGRTLLDGYTGDGTKDPEPAKEKAADESEPTEEEAIAALPASLREMIGRHQEDEKVARAALVTAIRAATEAYSEQSLNAKTTGDLNALSQALKLNETHAPDYSGQGLPRDPSADDVVDPPPNMADAIRASRAAAKAN